MRDNRVTGAATFTPTPSQEEILAGARGSVGDLGTRARSYAVNQEPDLGCRDSLLSLPRELLGQITTADVCFWRKADMAYALANVCFWGNSGETTAAYIFS